MWEIHHYQLSKCQYEGNNIMHHISKLPDISYGQKQTPLTFLVSKEDIALKELSAKFHQLEMETKSAKGL